LEEKAAARMGLAIVDEATCLPHAAREACQMCVDECAAAGYQAIEFMRVHPELDEDGFPLPDTGYAAPVVIESRCVGCGLCQSRCRHINADEKGVLETSAIVVQAGPGREDRVRTGSYVEMRKAREQPADDDVVIEDSGDYLPDFLDDG
jgi:NAD-dependent dihydropyrimidine dehydrogenase PreA subunit